MRTTNLIIILFAILTSASAQSKYIDSLQNIVAFQRHDSTELDALLNLTNEFLRKDIEKAKVYAFKSVALAQTNKSQIRLSGGYGYLIGLHQNSGRLDSASYYLNLLESLSKSNPSKLKIQLNYNQSAGLYYKNQGLFRNALPYMLDNLRINIAQDESKAGQLLNVGNVYHNLSEFKNAVNYHLQALTLFEKLENERGQSFCQQSLGDDLYRLRQFEKAKDYFLQSIKLKEKLQDKRGTITASTGLGDVYKELKQFTLSEKYYTQALSTSRNMKLMLEESRCQHQLGILYKQMGDISKAREHILSALKLARQAGDSTMSAQIRGELIGLDFQEKKEKEIETTLISNLNTLINSGDRKAESTEYSRLSEYYWSRKQFEKAFLYLKKYEQLKDSVEGVTVLLQIKELENKYEHDKKEKEIALLKKDQELQTLALSRQKVMITSIGIALISVMIIGFLLVNRYRVMNKAKRLIEIERMRNNIARDLHDDMGSALSSINILSQVALVEKNGNTQTYLHRIGEQTTRMMEDMGDMVWSINPRNDSMSQIIIRMREFASEIFELKNMEYSFSDKVLDSLILDADKRKNLFLIFKEIINNAAKYSHASNIEINLHQEDHTLVMVIKDNGQGFDEQTTKSGNGLRNLRERAKEINGTISLKSKIGEGTQIELKLPIA